MDTLGRLFLTTGDGPPNLASNFAYSVVRLGVNEGLSVEDNFTPCDQGRNWGTDPNAVLQAFSSAPLLLPDSTQLAIGSRLLLAASKEGNIYAISRDHMGGFGTVCPDPPTQVQVSQTGAAILSTPIFWNDAVYVVPTNGHLEIFPIGTGNLPPMPSSVQSQETLGPLGATPVISANGTSNAILWLIDTSGAAAGTPAILRAYDANNISNEIYNSTTVAGTRNDNAGPAVKFTVPTVANGKVYVGTQTELDVYGLL